MFGLFKKKAEAVTPDVSPATEQKSWLGRLTDGLSRSTDKLTSGITDLFTKRKLDAAALEQLEELLITADIGPRLAASLAADFGKQRFGDDVTGDEVREFLATAIAARLQPVAQQLAIDDTRKPFVVLMVGVNGSGKTTTLGKLASQLKADGKNVLLAAGDTFRAAAVEQLQAWGVRAGVPVLARATGADPAGLAYDAIATAQKDGANVVLIDTAGRLHNRNELMAELQKVVRAIKKIDATAPHATLLTLDATTGQNALSQVEIFKSMVAVDGLVVSKLDGTAKGGIVVALADTHKLPIVAIGVGEGIADLQAFDAAAFARTLVGLPPVLVSE